MFIISFPIVQYPLAQFEFQESIWQVYDYGENNNLNWPVRKRFIQVSSESIKYALGINLPDLSSFQMLERYYLAVPGLVDLIGFPS